MGYRCMTIFSPSFHHVRRSAGTGSHGFTGERFVAHNLKFFTAQRVLASVLDGITPRTAFSLSGEVVIGPNRL